MKVEKWYVEQDIKGSINTWLKKFDVGTLDGAKDMPLFYKAIMEATMESKNSSDDYKKELAELIGDDLENYGTLACYRSVFPPDELFR